MKKKYIIPLIGMFSMVILCQYSCKKYINEKPIDQTYDANFWTSQQSAEEAVAGAYVEMRNALENGSNYFVFGDLAGDEITTSAWNLQSVVPGSNKDFSYVPYYEPALK